jgi:hypothetical protein
MKRFTFIFLFAISSLLATAQKTTYTTEDNINYYPESDQMADAYIKKRCVLDLYHPKESKGQNYDATTEASQCCTGGSDCG